ncbi:MAG TPA: PaaI family thioesterase [Anaerovoracaceae bacterium]|nr:PaaI family thioesterase [Anaerovoracaceae bacterium]
MTPKERAQKILAADRFAVSSGVELVDADKGYAVCSLHITENHLNAAGAVQGGAIFTLADTAFGMAANNQGKLTVSINNSISYLKSTRGDTLIATASMISSSKRICTYEVEVKDNLGELIARMTGTGYIKDEKLPE